MTADETLEATGADQAGISADANGILPIGENFKCKRCGLMSVEPS